MSCRVNSSAHKLPSYFDDDFIFFFGEVATFEVRTEVINPAETAALAASEKTSSFRERTPTTFTMSTNIRYKSIIFFFSPCTFVCVSFLTTRRPSHNYYYKD
ncbi:hypothetical protein Lal_00034387 [Lupinus albus]|nr:hypothetical protein Lal_00034387 [Lupinus albus]